MNDLISRKEAIDWIKGWFETDKHYHPYSKGKTIPTCEVMDILERVPSAEQKNGRYVDLSEVVIGTYYDDEYEEWIEKTVTVEELLDTACDDYTVVEMPSAQPERIQNNTVHLCDSCQYTYVTCPSHGNDAVFGDGKGDDNICACNKYLPIYVQPENIHCKDCEHHIYGRCLVANHHTADHECCAEVFGAGRKEK
jgi:hypothetical protein